MKINSLKEKLKAGESVSGPFLKLTDPAVVEIAGHAGFDFVIIDSEHGPVSMETAQNLIRAAEGCGVTPIIRVTGNSPGLILRALDIGAHGVQVPQISTKTDALDTVKAAKYFPDGQRGLCRFVRAADYSSADRFEHLRSSNLETLVIVHIEGVEGVGNLEEILQVEALDVIFLGPYDLSQSCGVPGQVDHPKVVQKMQDAVELARRNNTAVGTFVETAEGAKKWRDLGVQYLSYSVDVGIFSEACSDIVKRLRDI